MNTVEITGSPSVSGNEGTAEDPWYIWTFPVVVNGQAGLVSIGSNSNDASVEGILADAVIEDLQTDAGDLGGISENDPGTDMDMGDSPDGGDEGDNDDTAVASNGGGDYGDSV